jgi:hypothetical protein
MPQFTGAGGPLATAQAEDFPLLLATRLPFPLLEEGRAGPSGPIYELWLARLC